MTFWGLSHHVLAMASLAAPASQRDQILGFWEAGQPEPFLTFCLTAEPRWIPSPIPRHERQADTTVHFLSFHLVINIQHNRASIAFSRRLSLQPNQSDKQVCKAIYSFSTGRQIHAFSL